MVNSVPGQEGAEGNVAEKKKVEESKKANLGKLLKYNAFYNVVPLIRVFQHVEKIMRKILKKLPEVISSYLETLLQEVEVVNATSVRDKSLVKMINSEDDGGGGGRIYIDGATYMVGGVTDQHGGGNRIRGDGDGYGDRWYDGDGRVNFHHDGMTVILGCVKVASKEHVCFPRERHRQPRIDELSDVEMEDITGYGASDFVGENDVVIPNRSINDPFLNKLCNGSYINDFTDKSDGGESSQPVQGGGEGLEIDSDDEDESLERVEVVVKKGKKGGWPYKKEKNEGELPKKDKGVLLRSPTKGKKCAYIRSPSKKGVQGQSSADKGKAKDLQDELDNGKIHFKRIYVCFKAMIEGWSAGCRKVIGLDGCFLKGTCRGELLTAMGRDGNNQILHSGAYLTVISDGHKGLMELVKNLLAHAEHRQCARHIYANFKKKWNGLHFKGLVDRNPNSWCRAFFKMDRGCAAYENGISESYHNAIRIARDSITPSIRKEIERLKEAQRFWIVYPYVHQWRDLSGVPCVHSVAAFSFLKMDPVLGVSAWLGLRGAKNQTYPQKRVNVRLLELVRMMTCHNCWEKGHNKKNGKNKKQPQPTIEKRTPGRKKADSNFVFPTGGKNGGDADKLSHKTPIEESQVDDIPTQQSKTSQKTAKIIEDAIATGKLKTAGLKRRVLRPLYSKSKLGDCNALNNV
ncbi:hypothetical protein Tco_0988225 [Tanacetum coccineum]|uniref:Transposase n=1 Tax=Tanacetum coccineum TaxID=301880 RepID=A0ABQ5EQF1_9ASTR